MNGFDGVETLYKDFAHLRNVLLEPDNVEQHSPIALAAFVDEQYKKALLLAAVSRFEQKITEAIELLLQDELVNGHPLAVLVYNAAIDRKFYSWFSWKEDNEKGVNMFFGLFGREFGVYARNRISADFTLRQSAGSFIRLGNLRNKLVHQDFADYSMNETVEEIYRWYQESIEFVDWVPEVLRSYINEIQTDT